MNTFSISLMQPQDLPDVLRLQALCYSLVQPESPEVIAQKLELAPQTCWIAKRNDQLLAYLLCHPWKRGDLPVLNEPIAAIPPTADLFYLHDLAVSPAGRRTGIGKALVAHALAEARSLKFSAAALIAVQGSVDYWSKFGFIPVELSIQGPKSKLLGYGPEALYMEAEL